MPTSIKISKEKILDSAFKIVREEGIEGLNIRKMAKLINCSIRPIYYQFKNMEELKLELRKKIEKYFYQFLTTNIKDNIPTYKQIGINYIKFAKEEKNLFKILFMTETGLTPENFINISDNYQEIEKHIKKSTNLNNENIKSFHIKMWIFTHGIASLVASNTCKLSDEQISRLLSNEFQALMLLEKSSNNK